ncbi:hypothetical protein BMR1_03g00895 [Babesia microti strain RI]|uniref:Uncharacterized protein n=1 Tax=Babesia microti (strain RI) TaxID=1133968 RepID=A0A1R4ABA1_BABMR|nr:hypothetical protein BMR1_03g00895 [Babesia microti strain RI]SJK86289.1 hypothetical protein BMR1_03g00895 [Babesia microti strain RI]|eukprot:XP_021338465.1 hypothetical protein BMR1_03g00895 [Babesia microti strain RI]
MSNDIKAKLKLRKKKKVAEKKQKKELDLTNVKKMPTEQKKIRFKPNAQMLSAIIHNNQRTNDRMDKEELRRAEEALQKLDRSGRKVRLMTEYLTGKN